MPAESSDNSSTPLHARTRAAYESVAAGWERWEPHFACFTAPVTQWLMAAVRPKAGHSILDVGCGTGDPAVHLATAVAPTGRVTAIDLSPAMLDVARRRALALRINLIDFKERAFEDADFPPGTFDSVVGRWSLIFSDRIREVLARVRGWLRTGGRLAVSTWTPMENSPGFLMINEAIRRVTGLPAPDPEQPGMQYLSQPGRLEAVLKEAGFRDVSTQRVPLAAVVRDGREYWEMSRETGASLTAVLSRLHPGQVAEIGNEVAAGAERFRSGRVLRIPAVAQVGAGTA